MEIAKELFDRKSALRTVYIGFRKPKLKKSYREHGTVQVWEQILKEKLRENMGQTVLGSSF
jgi:hypothetical protein